ncbi:Methyltransferase domain-containing protein [Chitinophaga sp. CF118]|uniref:class I SAM-dependent methyltransferase n=1 Tax=Chitinophaga sp. CF118 TaxID=1884367 RepID=UPI0008F2DB64|nr:class I SAM-dependent methyltransferase [Chitinophaga sp. CF118]SFD23057.1 Methyltransferase domain-containing protein [Chitinophaga sp. CF118]
MKYLRYFLYVAWHWGLDLAIFIVKHEIRGEKKYGISTIGLDNLSETISKEDRAHVSTYEPVNYYTSGWLFDQLQSTDTTFLDVGCGRGRVLVIAAAYGFKNIIGIDFSQKLCDEATLAFKTRYPDRSVTITCADARQYNIPDTVGVIFLFNPFDAIVMSEFIQKVDESLTRKNRPLKVLYANPQCKELWLDAGFKETASFVKKRYLKGCVLEKTI